jgi:hypothetical protein
MLLLDTKLLPQSDLQGCGGMLLEKIPRTTIYSRTAYTKRQLFNTTQNTKQMTENKLIFLLSIMQSELYFPKSVMGTFFSRVNRIKSGDQKNK